MVTPEDPGGAAASPDRDDGLSGNDEAGTVLVEGGRKPRAKRRWRRISSWVLVVVACILAVLSVVVLFARNQLLNTDTYVSTVTPLASNPDIQAAVAKQVSERLTTQIDVEQRVKTALPAKAGFLATPITSGLENVTEQITLKAVESSAFQKVWVTVNRASHKQLVALLTGSGEGALSSKNGRVTIDLSQVEVQAKKALDAKGITVFNKVPAVKGLNFVLFQSDDLVKVQRGTRLLNRVAVALPIIALLCFAAGIVLTEDRRRGLVRAATGLSLSMALVLIVVAVARNQYLSSLGPSRSRAANAAVIDTVSSSLRETVRIVLIVAALVAIGAAIAGSSHLRAWLTDRGTPSWMAGGPVHSFAVAHRKGLQWAVLGLGLVILVIWSNPTALVSVVVVLITLAAVGLVGIFAGTGGPGTAVAGPGDRDVAATVGTGDTTRE